MKVVIFAWYYKFIVWNHLRIIVRDKLHAFELRSYSSEIAKSDVEMSQLSEKARDERTLIYEKRSAYSTRKRASDKLDNGKAFTTASIGIFNKARLGK